MSENPYDSQQATANAEAPADLAHDDRRPFPHYDQIVLFAVRVIGVYMVAVGLTFVVQSVLEYVLVHLAFYGPSSAAITSAFVGNALYFAIGLYFVLSGRWVIDSIFYPPANSTSYTESENH